MGKSPHRIVVFLLFAAAAAQTPPLPLPKFDVASVRPADPNSRVRCDALVYPGGRLAYTNCTLQQLLHFAWGIPTAQITGGPAWLGSTGYTIAAEPPAGSAASRWRPSNPKLPPPPEEQLMLRALLLERFHLQMVETTVQKPALALERHGNQAQLVPSPDPNVFPVVAYGRVGLPGHAPDFLRGENASMALLAQRLADLLRRPVVDRTGLKGRYNFAFECAVSEAESAQGPSLFTALHPLGLRLVATTAAVPRQVVRSAQPAAEP